MKKIILLFSFLILFSIAVYGYWNDKLQVETQIMVCYDVTISLPETSTTPETKLPDATDSSSDTENNPETSDSELAPDTPETSDTLEETKDGKTEENNN